MTLKEKLAALKAQISALLNDADQLIEAGNIEEAKKKQVEIKSLRDQAEVIKTQIDTRAEETPPAGSQTSEVDSLKAAVKVLQDQMKKPAFPGFMAGNDEDPETDPNQSELFKSIHQLRFGAMDASVKAVMVDLYGVDFQQRRMDQMAAFVKYVRFGTMRLTGKDAALLAPSAKNVLVRPEVLADEIKSGRTVAEIKATLEESSNDLGGYLVPEDYRAEILQRLVGRVVVRARARVVTTARDAVEWPRLEGGNSRYTSAVRVTWVDETPSSATVAQTNPTFGMIRIPVHTVMARTDLSRNLLEDSAFNLLDIMAGLFADAMAIDEDQQFLIGQGAGTPLGVLGVPSGAEQTPITGVTSVNTGDASLLSDTGLINLVYSLDAQYRQNAVLIGAKNTYRDVRKIKDGEGRFVWQPGLQPGQPAVVLGHPAYESEAMPTIAANAYPLIFGDFGGYIIVDRVGMSVERVADTTTVGTNTVALFARRRLGGQPVMPWMFAAQKVSA